MTAPHLENPDDFAEITERYRSELVLHCYRLLGSLAEAEEMVQEAFLKAWQKQFQYRGEAPLRAWLYKIATNVCLDELRKRARRTLPQFNGPAADPREPFAPPLTDPIWLDLLPDAYWTGAETNPEARYGRRESVELAFLIAIHDLPPRQRAVLLLRDVLDWRTREVAALLESTQSSVNSALHRARQALARRYQTPASSLLEVDDSLLAQYLQAWESYDMQALIGLMHQEVTLAMPPSPAWYQGTANIALFLQKNVFLPGSQWRLRPLRVNGQPGFALYHLNPASGLFAGFGLQHLTVRDGRLAGIILYVGPELFTRFDLPLTLSA